MLNFDFCPGRDNPKGYYLIDRENGRCELKPLPEGERWGLLSVSPWRDGSGETEIVGQCHARASERDGTVFWGLARIRQSDGTLIDRVKLDVLPTSRACWLPDMPGEILFAAGDGQLYRHSLPQRSNGLSSPDTPPPVVPEGSGPRRVTWRCRAPGEGTVFLADPYWPSHPRLRHLLFVVLSFKRGPEDRSLNGPPRPWWLEMSRDGTEIEAAGPLCTPESSGPESIEPGHRAPSLRFPIAVDRNGMIELVYLSRKPGQPASDLIALQLELDPKTARPRPRAGSSPRLLARGCAAVPPICTSDGALVYGISHQSGVIAGYRLEAGGHSLELIALADK